ncbi:MAG TPA: DUF2059 domain-containing protein [Candidatus Acidoferrum sp.]|jgi:hypothetical protein
MRAVLALIVIYVGTFLVAIQGASNSSVEASGQESAPANAAANSTIDPLKERDIRSLLELVGAKDAIQESASTATDQYRQKVIESSANNDRAQAITNAYLGAFQKKFDADAVTGQLVGIYDQHFTDEEIKGLLEFFGSPLGQKVATEMPKINREIQYATRTATTQAARLAWQDLGTEYPNAGGTPRAIPARRRNFGANGQSQPQQDSSDVHQTQAASQQP